MTRACTFLLCLALAGFLGGCGFAGADVFTPYPTPNGPADLEPSVVTNLSAASGSSSRYGETVLWLDWNLDGIGDALIGAPGEMVGIAPGAGVVELHLGRGAGMYQHTRTFSQRDWAILPSERAGLGSSLATGDWNGDGRPDIAIGAAGESVEGVAGAGRIYVLFNTPGQEGATVGPFSDPEGPEPDASFGAALASGRVDAGAVDDLVVGAPDASAEGKPGAGHVVVFYDGQRAPFGQDASEPVVSEAPEAYAAFGSALAVGDLNADGTPELLIGAPAAAGGAGGRVETWRVPSPGAAQHVLTTKASTRAQPTGEQVGFGAFLALEDVDADGYLELFVGAPRGDSLLAPATGFVDVFHFDGLRFKALARLYDLVPSSDAAFGYQLACGDLDGDGHLDLAVASPGGNGPLMERAGHLTLFRGDGAGGLFMPSPEERWSSSSPHPGALFGASLSAWSPQSAERAQLLIGAPGTGIAPSTPGRVQRLSAAAP